NRGWEVAVNLIDISNKNGFRLNVSNLNISRNRNKILKLPQHLSEETYNGRNGEYAVRILEGRPLGAFFGYNCLGVYQNIEDTYARDPQGNIIRNVNGENVIMKNITKEVQPGDAKYADHNHDGIINRYDMVYLGNFMPILTGGGAIQLIYKQLSLRTSFHFRIGQKVINQTRIDAENMYFGTNQRRSVLNRWRYEGDDTNIPHALYCKVFNYLGSDRFVESNSFLKCKDITVSYGLPKTFVQKLGLTRMSCSLTTYNLFTITKYKGQDPETYIPSGSKPTDLAKDSSRTPPARKVAFNLSIDF
ncbi:MAG: SusC/RagA family TonB-linked outer membrane protein, partial [Odoribacter sp.]|nr:SusC/RagA family TonB-linked outer membrane protein [Odoribacter sp.]